MNSKLAAKIIRIATIGIIVYLLCFGVAMAFFPIRPFWNDEWRLIYNLKFKNEHQLWGTLDLLQQCPRAYLTILKKITSAFDYSYISLRLPALIISTASIFFIFHLHKKVFPGRTVYSYLFILIVISSSTFTDYLVQVKQYEMDIFLCLLALWQLIALLELADNDKFNMPGYLVLYTSFAAAPFLSYVYPIAIAPVFLVVLLRCKWPGGIRKSRLFLLLLPLLLVSVSIVIFYIIDVKQLMADNRMYVSYKRMLGHEKDGSPVIEYFWKFFCLVGSGFVFEIIFGVLGIAAFGYGVYRVVKSKSQGYGSQEYIRLYAVFLLAATLCLVFSGKLMGGVARLVAFTVPSIALLIVLLMEGLNARYAKAVSVLAGILFAGLLGNIASTCINVFTYPEYKNRIATYHKTATALEAARKAKVPILFTDGVKGDKIDGYAATPGKIISNTITPEQIAGVDTLCAEVVLKVNPGYKVWDPVQTWWMPDMKWAREYVDQLPVAYKSAIVCDGINFLQISR